jgi:REP element-mobilizing transposase RayT
MGATEEFTRAMSSSYTNLLYHIVFSTKDRQPWITDEIQTRLHEYMGGGIRSEGGTALAISGVADHVHILAKLRQDKSVSAIIGAIKANSCRWVHQEFSDKKQFRWQTGYGAFTVSLSKVEVVRRYIANQFARHQKETFQKEFMALLNAHQMEYDERFLWN